MVQCFFLLSLFWIQPSPLGLSNIPGNFLLLLFCLITKFSLRKEDVTQYLPFTQKEHTAHLLAWCCVQLWNMQLQISPRFPSEDCPEQGSIINKDS